ncbi:peptidylprolyl isomerase [Flavobacterium sp.]|jgi:peptidyl-prolyl cis-trans isomerase SurA|uniref:peptidylprolyl isomerase n=1 Tax=Flavobacterium sp. TaxID=239 RepID=UPI0035B36697
MRIKNSFVGLIFFISSQIFAQNSKEVLFTIDNKPYYSDEFTRIYKKNLDLVKDDSQKDLNQYLDLFIGYKLKVNKAYKLGLQENQKYQSELSSYRNQLSKNYVNDSKVTSKLIEEAYSRNLKEIRASHILLSMDENIKGADTLAFYNRALEIKKRIEKGESFEEVAQKESQDPSVRENKGDLGYFTAFRMVYPFESAAYKTPLGKISNPVRTRFGYHIIKVTDIRDNRGEVSVAHIMLMKPQENTAEAIDKVKQNIDDIYTKIQQGESFEALAAQFSDDKSTASKGGQLQRFSSGQLSSEEFEKVAFGLKDAGEISKPFQSQFGWHIVKLIEKYPVQSLDQMKNELESKIKRDERSIIITNSLAKKLKSKYTFETNQKEYQNAEKLVNDAIYSQTWEMPAKKEDLSGSIAVVNKTKKIPTSEFISYIHAQQKNKLTTKPIKKLVTELYDSWKEEQLITYYNDNLENEFPEFKYIMDEYRDGLLLFDLMEKEIWDKSKTDTLGLQDFYTQHKDSYKWKKRYDVDILSSTDEKMITEAKKYLTKGKSLDFIKEKLNKEGKVAIMVKSGLFEEDFDALKKIPVLQEGINPITKDANYYFLVKVNKIKPVEYKTLNECKSKVINDYQQFLESTWVDNLKKEFTIQVNNLVFEKVKAELNK